MIVKQYYYTIIGSIILGIFVASLISNSIVLYVFIKTKNLRKPINFFSIVLTCVNLLITIFYVPLACMNAFLGRSVFGEIGCHIQAFVIFFCGCLSIYLLVVLSAERFWIVYRPFKMNLIDYRLSCIVLVVCIFVPFVWALLPFFGWSYYTYNKLKISCCIAWNDHSFNAITYSISSVILFFVIPFGCLMYTNIRLLLILNRKGKKNSIRSPTSNQMNKIEVNQLKVIVSISSMYLLSWTPYSVASIWTAISQTSPDDAFVQMLPELFAKLSIVWCPLLELLFNKNIKRNLRKSTRNLGYEETIIKINKMHLLKQTPRDF